MGVMNRLNVQQMLSGQGANHFTLKVVWKTRDVLNAMDKKRAKVLYQTGAYARTTMERSMRTAPKKARNASKVRPPYTHRTTNGHAGALRRLIGFQVEERRGTVTAGPAIATFRSRTVPITAKTVPELLDKGGIAMVATKSGGTRRAVYRAFPFTEPAFKKANKKFEERIRNIPLAVRV